MGFTRVLRGVLFFVLLHNCGQVLSAAVPGAASVRLAWDASPGPGVAGYRVYYGAASGNYSNSVVTVGNVRTNTISGLAGGVGYFFVVTAYNVSGTESVFSSELSFVPGVPIVRIRITPAGQAVLTAQGLAGHTYDMQMTQDFKTWTVIGTGTVGAGGSLDFTDPNAGSSPKRFYRSHDRQP